MSNPLKKVNFMKNLPYIALSLLAYNCKVGGTAKVLKDSSNDMVQLEFSKAKVSKSKILSFSLLTPSEIVDKLRKDYGINVLVLNYPLRSPFAKSLSKEKVNKSQDTNAILYYENLRQLNKENAAASFIAKNAVYSSIRGYGRERPYINHDLMLTNEKVDKYTLIHEFMHFLIKEYKKTKDPSYIEKLNETDRLQEAFIRQEANLTTDLLFDGERYSKTQLIEANKKLLKVRAYLLNSLLTSLQGEVAEELDISRYFVENRNSLMRGEKNVHRKEALKIALAYYDVNLKKYKEKLQLLIKFYKESGELGSSLQALNALDEKSKENMRTIRSRMENRLKLYNEALKWQSRHHNLIN